MKRSFKFCIILLSVLLIPISACAFTWTNTDQATLVWENDPGNIAYEGERYKTRLFFSNSQTDPDKISPVELTVVDSGITQYTIPPLTIKGKYLFGAEVIIEISDDGGATWIEVSQSERCWSDMPECCLDGNTFGIRFYPKPLIIKNLGAR